MVDRNPANPAQRAMVSGECSSLTRFQEAIISDCNHRKGEIFPLILPDQSASGRYDRGFLEDLSLKPCHGVSSHWIKH